MKICTHADHNIHYKNTTMKPAHLAQPQAVQNGKQNTIKKQVSTLCGTLNIDDTNYTHGSRQPVVTTGGIVANAQCI